MDPGDLLKKSNKMKNLRVKMRNNSVQSFPVVKAKSNARRKFDRKKSALRGKNWLKFQLDKRRYQIGFPIGWGAFSVVYFAKANQFLEKEARQLRLESEQDPRSSCLRRVSKSNESEVNERGDQDVELPEFVAVKVVKLAPEFCNVRQPTLPELRLLRNPQNDKDKTFNIRINENQDEKKRKEQRKKVLEEHFTAERKATLFKRLGKEFDIEMNHFLERKAFRHFDPIDLDRDDNQSDSRLHQEKVKKKVNRNIKDHFQQKNGRIGFKALDQDEESENYASDESVVEEVLEIGNDVLEESRERGKSWFKNEIPTFLNSQNSSNDSVISRERAQTIHATTTLDRFDLDEDNEGGEDYDSLVEMSRKESSQLEKSFGQLEVVEEEPEIVESEPDDDKFAFLSEAIREKRKRTKNKIVGPLREREGSFDFLGNLKTRATQMLTNQLRGQIQSVMTEIVVETASQMEHESVLDDAVKNNLMSEAEKKEYIEFKEQVAQSKKEKEERGEEPKSERKHAQKNQSFEDISIEVKALRHMRRSNFAIYLFDVVQTPLEIWLVTEFAHIGCLQTFCEDAFPEGVPERILKWLVTPIFLALKHLHSCNMIHRDMKPSNIVLTHAGIPKLCDFGMVKEFEKLPVYKPKGFCGTEIYAPPEAFGMRKHYGTNFDTWSMGMTMLSLLFGVSNPWDYDNGVNQQKGRGRALLRNAIDNRRQKKYINYLAEKLEPEVGWVKTRKELLKLVKDDDVSSKPSERSGSTGSKLERNDDFEVEYVGVYKRLSLLEKQDIENPQNEEILILMYYKDMHRALTLRKRKSKLQSTEALDKQIEKLKAVDSLDVGIVLASSKKDTLARDLQKKLVKGVPEFSPERRRFVKFVRKCLKLYDERPVAADLLKDRYINKLSKSWGHFDARVEAKLLEIAVSGEFSCIEKEDFGGPYFNVRGEFMSAAKQIAMKIHQRFK